MAGDHAHHGGGGSGIGAKDILAVILVVLATIGFCYLAGWLPSSPPKSEVPNVHAPVAARPPPTRGDEVFRARQLYSDW